MIKGAVIFLFCFMTGWAQQVPEQAAPAAQEETPAKPSPPKGLTKNMIYLEYATVVGTIKDAFSYRVTILTDGQNKYCVYGFPSGKHAIDEAIPKVILVPGRVLEILGNRRAYCWFSDGVVTPELIAAYKKGYNYLDYPLGD